MQQRSRDSNPVLLLILLPPASLPASGLASAYLLASAITGHAPRLCRLLSTPCLRPLAVLSYSIYLLQYVGMQLMPHIAEYLESPVRRRASRLASRRRAASPLPPSSSRL